MKIKDIKKIYYFNTLKKNKKDNLVVNLCIEDTESEIIKALNDKKIFEYLKRSVISAFYEKIKKCKKKKRDDLIKYIKEKTEVDIYIIDSKYNLNGFYCKIKDINNKCLKKLIKNL